MISFKIRIVLWVTNSLNFLSPENILIYPSFLKDIFSTCRILGWQFFSFSPWKILFVFSCCLISVRFGEESRFLSWFLFIPWEGWSLITPLHIVFSGMAGLGWYLLLSSRDEVLDPHADLCDLHPGVSLKPDENGILVPVTWPFLTKVGWGHSFFFSVWSNTVII